MKIHHPHKPYLIAYAIYTVAVMVLVGLVIGIPIGWAAVVICNMLDVDPEMTRPWLQGLVRPTMSVLVGYFVFREVIRRHVLPQVSTDQREE